MTGEQSYRYADCVPMDKALELLKSEAEQALKYREIAGGAKNCALKCNKEK